MHASSESFCEAAACTLLLQSGLLETLCSLLLNDVQTLQLGRALHLTNTQLLQRCLVIL